MRDFYTIRECFCELDPNQQQNGVVSGRSAVCSLCVAGAVVRGPAVQVRGPMGITMQASANQKQKLNDPGGGTFRYLS